MSRIARVGDTHAGICNHGAICCPHHVTGTIVTGSENVKVNGKNAARVGDQVVHNCPHCGTGTIVEGSSTVKVNGKPLARIGDRVEYPGGSGTITDGSGNVNAG